MTLSTGDFDYVAALVRQRAAIVLEPNKDYLVQSRLAPVARRHGLSSVAALVARLRAEPPNGLHTQVIDAMTTNETSFFRDPATFDALERTGIPELIARRAGQRAVTFWSAACSSGQEPYSVAMLLHERFPELADWNVRIIASDLSADMLGRAAAGRYSDLEVSRGLPPGLLARHFRRVGGEWQVGGHIRQMVELRALNLVSAWPFVPPVDVLLLRNVLIYFDVSTRRAVLSKAARALRPDGLLVLGTAETTLGVDDRFERVQIDRAAFYRLRAT